MEDLVSLLLSFVCMGGMVCVMVVPMLWLALIFVLPFVYKSTFATWMEGPTVREAYEAVAVGSTTGPVQLRPASYLYEATFLHDGSKSDAHERMDASLKVLMLSKVVLDDDDGIVLDMMFPNGLGPGWVGVVLLEPDGEQTKVRCRWRSTSCFPFPVISFFLSLAVRLHLRRWVLGA